MSELTFSDAVMSLAEMVFDVPSGSVKTRMRLHSIVLARHAAIYVVRTLKKFSYPTIGRKFRLDHSTIIHAYRRIERLMADPEVESKVTILLQESLKVLNQMSERARETEAAQLDKLPRRIPTHIVCNLAGYSPATLMKRIAAGKMPKPVDKGLGYLFDRDEITTALGIGQQREVASW